MSDREDVVQEDLDTKTLRSQCALFTVDANVPAYLRLDALKGTTILVIDDPVLDKRSDLMVCTELVPFVNRYSRFGRHLDEKRWIEQALWKLICKPGLAADHDHVRVGIPRTDADTQI